MIDWAISEQIRLPSILKCSSQQVFQQAVHLGHKMDQETAFQY